MAYVVVSSRGLETNETAEMIQSFGGMIEGMFP